MEWSITTNRDWSTLEQTFSWAADMQHVPQDSIHHAEGDVAIHTRMVLEALQAMPQYQLLSPQQQQILWAAALLHDVEKRSTTQQEGDRITAPGHARRGERTAREILYTQVSTPFVIREQVAALVRYHGLPLWILEKPDPIKTLLEASLRVQMPLLALLAEADARGRICTDQRDLLDRIELFSAFCEEQHCWQTPRRFVNGLAQFTYFQKENGSPDYIPYDDLKSEVMMLSGLPGMGKDTFLKKHYPGLPVVSLDNIRRQHKLKPDDTAATGWAVQQAKEQAREYLRQGRPFAWNATNITRSVRTQWIDLFATYKARVRLVYIEVPYKDWLHQNKNREHAVPQKALMHLLQKLEVPAPHEAHEVTYVV
ncbi:AAA family ATPase [Fulvivirgaceae bacterium PWU5]|uniref:AAA family ATPase n=1 Tax=Dawidia cretensis TaxID=2782350 RepID=A0AAP2DTI1_9BACT|nr:AAA family ATPase [Dawidia cretensis]MBT1707185.1 AAA family ATPase [Dawidia cretensis]